MESRWLEFKILPAGMPALNCSKVNVLTTNVIFVSYNSRILKHSSENVDKILYCRPLCQSLSNARLTSKNVAEQYFFDSKVLLMTSTFLWHCWIVECCTRKPKWRSGPRLVFEVRLEEGVFQRFWRWWVWDGTKKQFYNLTILIDHFNYGHSVVGRPMLGITIKLKI